ncbi:MAG: hypothetical protein KDJ52_25300 [Anaerolineae bacterium]|nr:hypothetical protein [Anaerolineae bacterium]
MRSFSGPARAAAACGVTHYLNPMWPIAQAISWWGEDLTAFRELRSIAGSVACDGDCCRTIYAKSCQVWWRKTVVGRRPDSFSRVAFYCR